MKFFLVLGLLGTFLFGDMIKLSGVATKFNYVEHGESGAYLDSEKSAYRDIVGLDFLYRYDMQSGLSGIGSWSFSALYTKGTSKYDGSLFSTTNPTFSQPYQSTTDVSVIEPKIRYMERAWGDFYEVGTFVSAGYRYWKRDGRRSPYGYLEEYKWFYGDVGLRVIFEDGNWHLGVEGAYQRAFSPKLSASLVASDFSLGKTDGYYAEIPLSYNFSKELSIELAYRYERWDIEHSNTINGFYEPQSVTKNQLVKIGFCFRW